MHHVDFESMHVERVTFLLFLFLSRIDIKSSQFILISLYVANSDSLRPDASFERKKSYCAWVKDSELTHRKYISIDA